MEHVRSDDTRWEAKGQRLGLSGSGVGSACWEVVSFSRRVRRWPLDIDSLTTEPTELDTYQN